MSKRIRVTIVCVCCNHPGPKAGRGLRMSCYSRWHKRGELARFTDARENFSPAEHGARLLAQFGPDECWLWPEGKVSSGGYGPFRRIYEALVGAVGEGLELDHLCRVRACCNPKHLEPVLRVVNLARGDTFVRANLAKTRCPQGHAYTPENIYRRKNDGRECLTCKRVRTAARNAAKRAGVPYVDPYKLDKIGTVAA